MLSREYEGYEALTGSWAEFIYNGEKIWECTSIKALIKPKYEKVLLDGGVEDEKEAGRSGELEFKMTEISDWVLQEFLEDAISGKRKPFLVKLKRTDPNRSGSETELVINKVKLSGDIELFTAERQKLTEKTLKAIFNPYVQNVQLKKAMRIA